MGTAPRRSPESSGGAEADGILDRAVDGRRVRDSLAAAEADGRLIAGDGGRWRIAKPPRPSSWVKLFRDGSRNCRLQMVLFDYVYRGERVPAGCESCYKVKVVPRTLRELVAVNGIGEAMPHTFKCGLDAPAPLTSGIYGAYFYLHGLAAAKAAGRAVRQAVDAHPRLGPAVPVFVKRGCTEFEVRRGPSDQYTFREETREIERRIRPLFQIGEVQPETQAQRQQTFAHWIRTAYCLGDDTYMDFTGGRRLYPAPVRYELEDEGGGRESRGTG